MDRSRTEDLLLAFLRTDPGGTGVAGFGELSGTDWDDLLRTAARHGVTPLLYHRLATFHRDAPIPAEVIRNLRNSYLQNAGRNMHLYHELGKVLGRFRQDGIPVIALKGAHLAEAVYGNIALRPMGDADLLVKQADLSRVQDLLVELGYMVSKEETFCAQEHLPPYRKEGSPSIEIHFNIVGPPFSDRVDVEKLFVRAQACFIGGIEAWTLCPEDLLLHLCMHASYQHGFDNGILPLFDIATAVEHYEGELDWEQVLSRSKEWGVSKCVYLALSLAERIAGASIPEKLRLEMMAYLDGFNATKQAEELLFGKGTQIVPNMARLFGNNSLGEKLIHLVHRAFPPVKTIAEMNPDIRNPLSLYLLYLYRIKGLFLRHGRIIWKLFLGDKETVTLAGMENRRNELKDWLVK
jgi:hypothetical protein